MTACVTGLAEEALGIALELAQNVRRNFGRRKTQLAQLDARDFTGFDVAGKTEGEKLQLRPNLFEAAAHQTLDGIDDALRRFNERFARAVAHRDRRPAAACGDGIERNDRRHKIRAVHAGNDHRLVALHVGDEGIRGSQVDADDVPFRHICCSVSQNFGHVADQIA